ncbi:MAG: nitroreductase family protein [Candidatus Thorarchaeota archaeon]
MEFQKVVNKRKMIRSFTKDLIPKEKVDQIITNFFKGPSAGFSQGVELLVLNNKADIERYFNCLGPKETRQQGVLSKWEKLENAQLILIPLAHKEIYLERYAQPDKGWKDKSESHWPVPFWLTDTAMGAMIALLTIVDLGIGAVFVGLSEEPTVRKEFNIPDEYKPIGALLIGNPDLSDPPSPSLKRGRRKREDIVHYGSFEKIN